MPNTLTSRVLACRQLSHVKCEPIRFYLKLVLRARKVSGTFDKRAPQGGAYTGFCSMHD